MISGLLKSCKYGLFVSVLTAFRKTRSWEIKVDKILMVIYKLSTDINIWATEEPFPCQHANSSLQRFLYRTSAYHYSFSFSWGCSVVD